MILQMQRSLGRARGGRRRKRGQALVEFALVLVFFLIFLLAVLDLGRVFFTLVGLENAAAEGALYGMANPNCIHIGDCTPSPQSSIEYRVQHESENALMDPSQIEIEVNFYSDTTPGSMIGVTVTYPFRPIVPFLSSMGAETITLRRAAFQLIP